MINDFEWEKLRAVFEAHGWNDGMVHVLATDIAILTDLTETCESSRADVRAHRRRNAEYDLRTNLQDAHKYLRDQLHTRHPELRDSRFWSHKYLPDAWRSALHLLPLHVLEALNVWDRYSATCSIEIDQATDELARQLTMIFEEKANRLTSLIRSHGDVSLPLSNDMVRRNLSVTTCNALKREGGYFDLVELTEVSAKQLLGLRTIGKHRLHAIVDFMHQHRLSLKDDEAC